MSATKKYRKEISPKLQYHLFDILDTTLTFEERYRILIDLVTKAEDYCPNLVLTPTYSVESEEDIMKEHIQFIDDGYEGIIIRMADGLYKPAHRDISLQKLKNFVDDEFLVVDIDHGKGKNLEVAKFICQTKEGKLFNVDYNAPLEERQEMLINKDNYIGRLLTVKYQELSDDNVPRFGKGISFRDVDIQG
jgi:DNA ligase-1